MPSPLSSASLTLSSSSSLFFASSPQLPFAPPKLSPSLFNSHTAASKSSIGLVVRAQAQLAPIVEAPRLPVLSFSGDVVGEASLAVRSAPPDTARAVVHRGLIADRQNARKGTASTLTRGEVRGGGKKPYPQKKTGGARRGSQRTPLRPGGGVIFGPKPRDWSIKINRKEKRLAISTAIASAARAADALVVDDFDFPEGPRTKEFVAAMRRWGLDPKRKSTFLMTDVPDNVQLSCRNIGTIKMLTPRTLNLFDVLDAEKLIFTRSAIDYLNSVYGEDVSLDYEDEDEGEEEGEELLAGDEGGENQSS